LREECLIATRYNRRQLA